MLVSNDDAALADRVRRVAARTGRCPGTSTPTSARALPRHATGPSSASTPKARRSPASTAAISLVAQVPDDRAEARRIEPAAVLQTLGQVEPASGAGRLQAHRLGHPRQQRQPGAGHRPGELPRLVPDREHLIERQPLDDDPAGPTHAGWRPGDLHPVQQREPLRPRLVIGQRRPTPLPAAQRSPPTQRCRCGSARTRSTPRGGPRASACAPPPTADGHIAGLRPPPRAARASPTGPSAVRDRRMRGTPPCRGMAPSPERSGPAPLTRTARPQSRWG